jgi:hypothetical protein
MISQDRLFRGLELLKAFCAYNMVMVHAVSVLVWTTQSETFFGTHHHGLEFIRASFSMLLPAFAGFYTRHFIGPVVADKSARFPIAAISFRLIYFATLLEFIRQLLMRLKLDTSFTWASLHFCALAAIITLVLASRRTLFVLLACVLCVPLRYFYQSWMSDYPINPGLATLTQFSWEPWAWGFLLGFLVWGFGWQRRKYPLAWIGGAITILLGHFIIQHDTIALGNIHNLPYSIFLLAPKDNNFWPLLVFYPLFACGYFCREYGFKVISPMLRYASWLCASGIVLFAIWQLPTLGLNLDHDKIIHRAAFDLPALAVFALGAYFYLMWQLASFLVPYIPTKLVHPWLKWNRSVLTLYVTHLGVVSLVGWTMRTFGLRCEGLFSFYLLLHGVYVLSLVVAYNLSRFVSQLTGSSHVSPRVSRE